MYLFKHRNQFIIRIYYFIFFVLHWLINFIHRSEILQTIYPADVVLFEGILVFYFPEIRSLFHMKLFVDTDSDTRLARRGTIINFALVYLHLLLA